MSNPFKINIHIDTSWPHNSLSIDAFGNPIQTEYYFFPYLKYNSP